MHHEGYTGSKWATTPEIRKWLTQDIPVPQQDQGWDFYCQSLMDGSQAGCGNNPFSGDKNIYGDPFSVTNYAYVGGEVCLVVCGSVTYQDGTFQASVGGLGFGGFGKVVGANAYTPDKSALWNFGACASLDVGGCVQGTRNSSGNIRYGVGVTFGEGAFAGLMVSPVTWDLKDREFQLLGWKWGY